jgi:hypothetical protein
VAEFTMPDESPNKAVLKIYQEVHFWANDSLDVTIGFPKSEEQQEPAKPKPRKRRR